jgi:hypothetical protein
MSNELESDRAMVMTRNFDSSSWTFLVIDGESFVVDGHGVQAGYDETETEPPSSTNPQ